MKILFTGGGTGGHFYPIIAVVQATRDLVREKKLIEPIFYFAAPDPYNEKLLFDNQIYFIKIPAGKSRIYFSFLNFFDYLKTGYGILKATWKIFWVYPDIIFSKGGYGSFPVIIAGKILGIPILVHESDSIPGRANVFAAKYAEKIAVSYPDAAKLFDEEKVAWTGNPVRKEISLIVKDGAAEFLDLEGSIKTILILGGSQGAQLINDMIIDSLPRLVENFQVIHQTGKLNFKEVKDTAELVLKDSEFSNRYRPYEYMDDLAMRMAAGASHLIISRAGSTIFEIALWGIPSIIIPITDSNGDHQRKNAYNYARSGACVVMEEANISSNLLISEINRIITNPAIYTAMRQGAKLFAKPEAAKNIANEILELALKHEK